MSNSATKGDQGTNPLRRKQRESDDGFVAVGRVLAPFGIKGEVKVQPLSDNPARFQHGSRIWVGQEQITITHARSSGDLTYISLEGYADRASVERFRGAVLQVPEGELPVLAEGTYYRFQLIGLTVRDPEGTTLGTLVEVIETGANDVYRIRAASGTDLLLPATGGVVLGVDRKQRTMIVDPPPWR